MEIKQSVKTDESGTQIATLTSPDGNVIKLKSIKEIINIRDFMNRLIDRQIHLLSE